MGALETGFHDLFKTYSSGRRGVLSQAARNIRGLQIAFGRCFPGQRLEIDHLLNLPDHDATAGCPPR